MTELRACPFCGGKAGWHGDQIECDCGASVFLIDGTNEDTVRAWNKREGVKKEK